MVTPTTPLTPTESTGPGPGRSGRRSLRTTGGSGRRPVLLIALVCGGTAVVGLLGGTLLFGGGDDTGDQGVVLHTRSSPGAAATGTASASAGVSPTGDPTVTRDPFRAGASAGSPTTSSTSSTTSGASPTDTPTDAASGTPTTTSKTGEGSPSATVTVTVTPTPASQVVGLYGWTTDGHPDLRVGATTFRPALGASFGTGFRYTAVRVAASVRCAEITYAAAKHTLCPGEVLQVP